jgi:hypothetical membrane protein
VTGILAFLSSAAAFRVFGIGGTLAALLGVLASGLAYRGRRGERFSPFNHFISELGEVGVSRLAWAFNAGLILAGLLLLPECIGLGLLLPGVWARLGMLAGGIAALALALVGVFPMNRIGPHIQAAMTYFRLGLVMVLCFSIAIFAQPPLAPVLPRMLGLAGVPAVLAYTYFLLYSSKSFRSSSDALSPLKTDRPRVWALAVSEWLIFLTTLPWFLAVALGV